MSRLVVLSGAEQAAAHLREELLRGTWSGLMPGGDRLATELGIGRGTVEVALGQLEKEGLLLNQGRRRGRIIAQPSGKTARPMQVGILHFERSDRFVSYMVDLQHELAAAGHTITFSAKSLIDLDMDLSRIKRLVKQTETDAWVVMAGSREILEWFSALGTPTIALFGRRRGLPIAAVGPNKLPAMAAATRALLDLGHKRIVLLTRSIRRLPKPGAAEQEFLNGLSAYGLPVGNYNMPDWEENIDGFYARMETLFQVTPPTALIVDEARFFVATQQFLATKGLRTPHHVSLVCTDPDPAFEWCRPAVSHIRWDSRPVVRRIVRWADNVSRGKRDVRQTLTTAEFVHGGTIGPMPQ
jgi:DNA-binding LacI/PurR family transcriptional regulator